MGEIGYKGFEQGLICKGKQYAENTVFEEEKASVCNYGMHYCKNPMDVLDYYGFVGEGGKFNEFATVEPMAKELTDDNKKYCTTKLKVGVKFNFAGFVKACVDFIIEKTKIEMPDADVDSGDYAQIGSSGNSAQIGSSGDYAKIGSSGNSAKIGSSGDYAQVDSTGKYAVVMCAGHNCKAKAKKGSFITLAEWEYSEELNVYIPINVKTRKVDGKNIKEDTYYKLVGGKFVAVE